MSNILSVIDNLIKPQAEFSAMPFWFINDDLQADELKSQLEDFKAKGIDGVVVHPRIGIPKSIPYLSDVYFEHIKFIVESADSLEMKIILYDEGMYPSGAANGLIVKENPKHAAKAIVLSDEKVGRVLHEFSDGKFLVEVYSGGTIRGIHFGEDDGEEFAPKAADILNPEVVSKFIELTHDQYYKHLKKYFGNTIIAFFTDEPEPLGRNTVDMHDWTDGIDQLILDAGGKLEELRGLFDGVENNTTRLHRLLIRDRFNEVYYKVLSLWCEKHGIALTGHPAASDDIDEEIHFQVPGQDLIFRMVSPEEGGIYNFNSVQGKCSADAARHLGRRRNSNECFGVCVRDQIPWYFTGEDMKWYIDWLGVRGVNLFLPHAFYYSIRGKRKDERPPDVGPNSIWWPHYNYFSSYMKRVSNLMTDSINVTNIAILCESKDMPWKELIPLYENQIEFNYLAKALIQNKNPQNVEIEGYNYDIILNPEDKDFKEKCNKLVETYERDFVTSTFCQHLRVTHVIKDEMDFYFLFNEGNTEIDTLYSTKISGNPIFIDLWNGFYKKGSFELKLRPFETLLIGFSNEKIDFPPLEEYFELGNITNKFIYETESTEDLTKTYVCKYDLSGINKPVTFEVTGEEMAECYLDGKFVGVSFASPHKFDIDSVSNLHEIKIIMTGNLANKYSDSKIDYGLNYKV